MAVTVLLFGVLPFFLWKEFWSQIFLSGFILIYDSFWVGSVTTQNHNLTFSVTGTAHHNSAYRSLLRIMSFTHLRALGDGDAQAVEVYPVVRGRASVRESVIGSPVSSNFLFNFFCIRSSLEEATRSC